MHVVHVTMSVSSHDIADQAVYFVNKDDLDLCIFVIIRLMIIMQLQQFVKHQPPFVRSLVRSCSIIIN